MTDRSDIQLRSAASNVAASWTVHARQDSNRLDSPASRAIAAHSDNAFSARAYAFTRSPISARKARRADGREVGRARGVKLPEDFIEKQLAFAETLPHEMRASLLHDLEAGNRLEAPWLCGAVARMSEQAGLQAPVNRTVYAALKPFVNGR